MDFISYSQIHYPFQMSLQDLQGRVANLWIPPYYYLIKLRDLRMCIRCLSLEKSTWILIFGQAISQWERHIPQLPHISPIKLRISLHDTPKRESFLSLGILLP